jgi:hypothetical protein
MKDYVATVLNYAGTGGYAPGRPAQWWGPTANPSVVTNPLMQPYINSDGSHKRTGNGADAFGVMWSVQTSEGYFEIYSGYQHCFQIIANANPSPNQCAVP